MANVRQFSSFLVVLLLVFVGVSCAEEALSTQIVPGERVTRVSTALNHISIVQFPEPVVSAAIGSDAVRMEYHDNRVLIQPLKAGVDTNLFVWTENFRRTYEILPAGDVAKMSYFVDEVVPPLPPLPPGPTTEEVRKHTDEMFANVLMSARAIDNHKIKSHDITIRVKEISENAGAYYVHLSAANRGDRPYRLMEPSISVIHPAFAANAPLDHMNQQIARKVLKKFGTYATTPVDTHGSTLTARDLRPGEQADWIVAVTKPDTTPGIYLFAFAPSLATKKNTERPVSAVAIF